MTVGRISGVVAVMVDVEADDVHIQARSKTIRMTITSTSVCVADARLRYHRRNVATTSVRNRRMNTPHFRHLKYLDDRRVVAAAVPADDGATVRHLVEYSYRLLPVLTELRLLNTTYWRNVVPVHVILQYDAGRHSSAADAPYKLQWNLDHLLDRIRAQVLKQYETSNRLFDSKPIRSWPYFRPRKTDTSSRL